MYRATAVHRLLLSTLGVAALTGCGSFNEILGSLSSQFDMRFDAVEVYLQDTAVRIEYVDHHPSGSQRPLTIIVETDGLSVGDNSIIAGELFLSRVVVDRVMFSEDARLPGLHAGTIFFAEYGVVEGDRMVGELNARFDGGMTLAAGFSSEDITVLKY